MFDREKPFLLHPTPHGQSGLPVVQLQGADIDEDMTMAFVADE
jgi:hypothetical protein